MYLTLSSTIEKVTKNRKLNKAQIQKLIERFDLYDSGDYIYPRSICIDIGIDLDTMYNLLFDLEKERIVKKIFEVSCSKCEDPEIHYYEDMSDIPDTMFCNNCFEDYSALENSIVIFSVV